MKCPECKHKIPEDSTFCYKCGCHIIEGAHGSKNTCVMDSERKLVTVMFSDMSGYTAMTERLDPEEVKEIMSQIFGQVTEIIKKYDGFIERFIGDAVMAVFGVPKAHEDDPLRAIRAALEIHAAVEDFSPQFEQKIGRSLTMHTGINTGLVVTGEVDVEKGTHGLTGDVINLSSRLEGIAQAGEIIVGESTYQLSKGYFNFESLEPTQVKGKAEPIPLHKFISTLDQQVITKHLQGVQADLTGRDAEMDMLQEALENLKQGQGAIVSIVGHAGTGKSRLIREFKSRIDRKRVQWREGHAYAYTQNMAYYPLTNLLTHAFRIREGDKPEQIKDKVESGVQELLWDKPEAIKYLGGLFSITYAEIDGMNPEFWRKQLRESVQQLLNALASRSPTVVLFEDLHWADVSFINLLQSLIENTHRPILLLCVYRPSFHLFPNREFANLPWPYHEINLREMTWEQTQSMLKSLLNSEILPDELRYFVKQRVEGNPFYLEEVINSLIETGILTSENGGWKLSQSLNLADIPPTIQGVLTARLDRLEKEAKRILQEASVIGRAFYYEVLNRVTALNTRVNKCLLGLESLDLIRTRSREPDLEYIFKHALTQEVVYNGLLKEERREIHERIGTVMELLFQNRLSEFYETLAHHFARGKSVSKAVDYLLKSGRKCLDRYAVEEAHQYFRDAYKVVTSKQEISEADKIILIDILNSWGYSYYYLGEFKEFVDIFGAHQKMADSLDDKAKTGMFYAWFGVAQYMTGESKTSYGYLCKALELGQSAGDQKVVGYACTWLPWACSELGFFDEGIAYGERAQQIAEAYPSDQYLYFKSLAGLCFIYNYKGDMKKVFEGAERLLAYGEKNSNSRSKVFGYWMHAWGHLSSGDITLTQKYCAKAMESAMDPFYRQFHKLILGFSYLSGGQIEEAENILRSAIEFTEKRNIGQLSTFCGYLLAATLIAKGQMSQGLKSIKKFQATLIRNKQKVSYAISEYIMGEVYAQIATGPRPSFSILVKNVVFLVKNAPFAAKKAESHYHEAVKLFEEIDSENYKGLVFLSLGRLYKARNKTSQARQCLQKAAGIFKLYGAKAYQKQAQEALDSIS